MLNDLPPPIRPRFLHFSTVRDAAGQFVFVPVLRTGMLTAKDLRGIADILDHSNGVFKNPWTLNLPVEEGVYWSTFNKQVSVYDVNYHAQGKWRAYSTHSVNYPLSSMKDSFWFGPVAPPPLPTPKP